MKACLQKFALIISAVFLVTSCAKYQDHQNDFVTYDIIIQNGDVFSDGHESTIRTDIAIVDDQIVAIGDLDDFDAKLIIDASGKLVVPGFIDVHSHADDGGALPEYLHQGVTTIVAGNCGRSGDVAHLKYHYDQLEGNLGPNYISLVGHNSLRKSVKLTEAKATDRQLEIMKDHLRSSLDAGAFGMSTGLIYNPGFNAPESELVELASIVAEYDGLYATHMRSEGEGVLESVKEAIRVGRKAGTRVQISHVKCAGPPAWGLADEYLKLIDEAGRDGVEVWADQYPYAASQTTINAIIPDWAENSWEDSLKNRREELELGIKELIAGRGGADRVYMVTGPFPNRTLGDVSAELELKPEIIVIEEIGLGGARAVYHMMQEDDVQTFMVHPRVMTGSDGPSSTHPRGFGSFPRIWGDYGREQGLLTHQDCVLKTSTLAATQFRLFDEQRGRISEGYFADIVIFDPETITDHATFEDPDQLASGISHVLVNGVPVVADGKYSGETPGRVLKYKTSR